MAMRPHAAGSRNPGRKQASRHDSICRFGGTLHMSPNATHAMGNSDHSPPSNENNVSTLTLVISPLDWFAGSVIGLV